MSQALGDMAKELFESVKDGKLSDVEETLSHGDTTWWRTLIRYELELQPLMEYMLKDNRFVPMLLAYEISTLSSFHLAALLGHNDIIMACMEKDIPVDIVLQSGTTALHIAAFAGHLETVNILIAAYKADKNKQDKYGWSALHYACSEGHAQVTKALVDAGADFNLRDQDGTTAAFRAQICGREEIVGYLCTLGGEDELLNVEESDDDEDDEEEGAAFHYLEGDTLYSMPKKAPSAEVSLVDNDVYTGHKGKESNHNTPPVVRQQSEPVLQLPVRDPAKTPEQRRESFDDRKFSTLPPNMKKQKSGGSVRMKGNPAERMNTIRKIIRSELASTFEDGYQSPAEVRNMSIAPRADERESLALTGIGVRTLKGLMREEFEKYKMEFELSQHASAIEIDNPNADYEDLYSTLKNLGPAPAPPHSIDIPPPGAPPLPPRNPIPDERGAGASAGASAASNAHLMLNRRHSQKVSQNAALGESIKKLSQLLGRDWKKLAYVLPIDPYPNKVEGRVHDIEKRYPKDCEKQAAVALSEWRLNLGARADCDCLIVALRECKLEELIPAVERVTQEFTA